MTLNSADPFARFRSSMATSHTDSPNHHMGSPEMTSSSTPLMYPREGSFPPEDPQNDAEDDALLRLVEEATAATDEAPGGFTVTATSSTTVPGSSFVGVYSAAASLSGPFGAAPPPPPPPPVSPPSFAETMAAHPLHPPPTGTPVAAMGQQPGLSPLVYHAPTPTTPATPATQPSSVAAESMIVRTQKGVFLLQPVTGGRAAQSPCGHGQSPPVSPLPSYALPPALPPAANGGSFALGGSVGYAAKKAGLSPPQYAAPPPYWKH